MHAFNVADVYEIQRRVVVLADKSPQEFSTGVALTIGDWVELRVSGRCVLKTSIAGMDVGDATRKFAFMLPLGIAKLDVPIGAEVWVSRAAD